ncbi:hypothetical protein C8Q75DRAFT_794216 [Abortiporus biennis]|nr:hypothetical protein C8Q75DRAFT_794216 [Abortiporus biennis]
MDFDLGLEVDHRKRRRNRTTQSCLNCHTSKRKCDRKRPCQRCIQLGLTGLCVYEVDDPALRDDPNIDENTRLRNRIAELESLVRELRGKPHPRWAEPNFCDGDVNEKWHSRSSRRAPQFQRPKREYQDSNGLLLDTSTGSDSPVVKVEHNPETSQRNLYRLTDSPPQQHHLQGNATSDTSSLCSYPSSSNTPMDYTSQQPQQQQLRQTAPSGLSLSNGNDLYYHQTYIRPSSDSSPVHPSCTCLTNPAAGHPLIALTHQLQSTMELLRQLPEHSAPHRQCAILKRVTELNELMHGGTVTQGGSPQYDALPTPTESELMSPISTSSHSSLGNPMQQDWSNMGNTTSSASHHYDAYFPVNGPGGHGSVYHKSYHIN